MIARSRPPFIALAGVVLLLGTTGCGLEDSGPSVAFASPGMAVTTPEEVGLSSDRLERLSGAMQALIDEGRLAGMTTMLAREGAVTHFETYGYRDVEAGDPMPPDAIFRIYSMTKPITGVALMMLYEEGKFRLSDPVARYIPELADLRVAAGEGPDGPLVEEPDHPI
ncbi:MAG: serine hydrolase domain-containing protein, partial [Gemmatimonadota bacterium]|nr:serine hydrolase domain-containing protein [Gemmatimonadota bacterium]